MNSDRTASRRNRENEDLLVFVHIPKTAGSTLNTILANQYSREATYEIMMRGMSLRMPMYFKLLRPLISASKIHRIKAALRHRRDLRLIHGHFDLSLGRLLPADARFLTLLRAPVERAVSHHRHYRRLIGDPAHALAMRSTLREWVGSCGLVEMDNGQTRRLAGEMTLPIGEVSSRTLDKAKANLVDKFSVVGLTERFQETQILLHRQFNWPYHRYPARNVGSGGALAEAMDAGLRQFVEDRNCFDLELYRFAAELFEHAIGGIDMDRELALLRNAPQVGESACLGQRRSTSGHATAA